MSIQPKLKVFDISMIVVSLVIGIGIFRTPSIIAGVAQTPTIFFLAWIVGGIVTLFGALTYAEIGSRYPVPGGFYKVFSTCYHPAFAFMLNWVLVLTYGAGAAGVMLIGIEYLAPVVFPVGWQNPPAFSLAVVLITLTLGTINYLGIKSGSRTQNLLSIIKIVMIVALCLTLFLPAENTVVERAPSSDFNPLFAMGTALIAVFYTYGGYQQTMNFGGDIIEPQKNMSRGILLGVLIIVVLYLSINYAYFKVLGVTGIADSKLVAAELSNRIFGQMGSDIVSITIFLSVIGFANATIMANPRIYYAMAEDGVLPKVFARVNKKTQVQEWALILFIGIIILSIYMLGTFEKIVSYVMAIDTIALGSSAAAVFILRKRKTGEDSKSLFKMPLYPVLPIIFILFLFIVFINVIITDTQPALIGLGLFALGGPLYYLITRRKNG